jgi:hypothetical protein
MGLPLVPARTFCARQYHGEDKMKFVTALAAAITVSATIAPAPSVNSVEE